MSGPYNSYPPQDQGYGGGYPPQQSYNQGYQYGQPQQNPQQGYSQYPPQDQNFGPPRRQDSFGPPQVGGFQHGQAGGTYGTYEASNPQGQASYYGSSQQYGGNDAYAQNQAYQNQMAQGGSGQQQPGQPDINDHQFSPQSSDPNAPNYDPNAPPMTESDRGFLGAVGGSAGGFFLGKQTGHRFLGTVGGAILGSLTQDMFKDKRRQHHASSASAANANVHSATVTTANVNAAQGSQASSWGGSRY